MTGAFSYMFNHAMHPYAAAVTLEVGWGEARDTFIDWCGGYTSCAVEGGLLLAGGPVGSGVRRAAVALAARYGDDAVAGVIRVSRSRFGEAAEHIFDAQRAGHPSMLTTARASANANRAAARRGYARVAGKDLDEYPPAMFKEGGRGASIRAISRSSNRSARAFIGQRARNFPNGSRVRIDVVD